MPLRSRARSQKRAPSEPVKRNVDDYAIFFPMSSKDLFGDALAYERLMGRWSVRLAPLFAEFGKVTDDARLLDVGCGTGSLTKTLLSLTHRADILGIDPAVASVEYARAHVKDPRVAFEVGDAQALPYPSGSFDAALSMLVLHFIPDPAKAAAEMRRVTRPGGPVAACTWDEQGMEMSGFFWDVAVERDPAVEAKRQRPMTRAGELGALWRSVGFQAVEERALEISMDFASFEDYWGPMQAGVGPIGAYIATLDPARREPLRAALEARLRARGAPGPVSLKAKSLAVRGLA